MWTACGTSSTKCANNLPDEIRESKKIVNDREQIMKNAQVESETIIQKAEERAAPWSASRRSLKRSRQLRRRGLDRSQHPGKGFDQKCNGVL